MEPIHEDLSIPSPISTTTPLQPEISVPTPSPSRRTIRKKIVLLFCLIVSFVTLSLLVIFLKNNQGIRGRARESGVRLSLSPATATLVVGQEAILSILMNAASENVSAVELYLQYPKDTIAIEEIQPTNALPVILQTMKSSPGQVTIILGAKPESVPTGAQVIATVKIKVLAQSTLSSSVTLSPETKIAVFGNTTNALGLTSGTAITVKNSRGPLPFTRASKKKTVSLTPDGPKPDSVTISRDTPITWWNMDLQNHVVRIDDVPQVVKPGRSFTKSFPAPGTYTYTDNPKSTKRVKGTIIVK